MKTLKTHKHATKQLCASVLFWVPIQKETKMKIMQNVYGLSTPMYYATWAAFYGLNSAICMVILYVMFCFAAPVLVHVTRPSSDVQSTRVDLP